LVSKNHTQAKTPLKSIFTDHKSCLTKSKDYFTNSNDHLPNSSFYQLFFVHTFTLATNKKQYYENTYLKKKK